MKHVTRWSPDTCGCVIEFEWDDEEPDETRKHDLTNYVSKCPAHQELDVEESYNIVKDENVRKNKALSEVLKNTENESLFDIKEENGTSFKALKPNVKYNWSWSGTVPNRILNIEFTGAELSTADEIKISGVAWQKH